MEENLVLGLAKRVLSVLEVNALLMAIGGIGFLGQHVRVIVRRQDQEDVTSRPQKMEENLVLVQVKSLNLVQMVHV